MNVLIDPSKEEMIKRLLAFSCCSCITLNSILLSISVPSTLANGSYLLNLEIHIKLPLDKSTQNNHIW